MELFKFGCIVDGEYFCPRTILEKDLRRYITGGQNLVIPGERRRGKSSLVSKVVRDIRGMGLLYVDLLGISDVADLCARIMDGITQLDSSRSFLRKTVSLIATLRPLVALDVETGLPTITVDARSAGTPTSLAAVLGMVAAHARERRICVVFDEFQDVLNLRDANKVLSVLRSKIQFMAETSFIFLGSVRNQMSEIFSHPRSPFFKSALDIGVDEISEDDFVAFLAARFRKGRRRVSDDFIRLVIMEMDAVPGDVQELCDALCAVSEEGDAVDESMLLNAYRYVFSHEGASYETFLKILTPLQLNVLRALASCGGRHVSSSGFREAARVYNASSVKKALLRLINT